MGSSWFSPCVDRQVSPIHGTGLFAITAIPANTLVVVKGGTYLTGAEIDDLGAIADGSWLQVEADLFLGASTWAEREACMTRVNGTCDPGRVNLGMRGQVTGYTRCDVAAGEELLYPYGTMFVRPGWTMECNCGFRGCRGVITGNDWRDHAFQEQHAGWFTMYAQSLIDAAAA